MTADENQNVLSEIPAEERKLLAGVERRIGRAMWVLGIAGLLACGLWRGSSWAAGFAIGAILSALNFFWMKSAISALADAVSSPPQPHRPKARSAGAVARFVLRYALIALAGYVIFRSSAMSLSAFFVGLFLAIAALLAEIAYEVYCGFRSA